MTLVQLKNKINSAPLATFPSFFGDFFNDFMNEELTGKNVFRSIPSVNILENENGYVLELAVPGMNKEDFKLELEQQILTISAENKTEQKKEGERFTRKEFSYSSFSRSFNLPKHINSDAITAEYVNGILKLSIPKKAEEHKKTTREIVVS